MISHEQYLQLLRPINGRRVSKDPRGFSHVEAYEARAHMNRVFGWLNWSEEVTDQQIVFETQHPMDDEVAKRRGKWDVCYRSIVRLTVRCPDGCHEAVFTEGACGDATNQPVRADAHDLSLKTSQSQAFKRAAANLGDQFGLSLYNKGSLMPLVGKSLVAPEAPEVEGEEVRRAAAAADESVDAHITTLAPEVPAEAPLRETSSPTPPSAAVTPQEWLDDEAQIAEANADVVFNGRDAMDLVRERLRWDKDAHPMEQFPRIRQALTLATQHGLLEKPTKTGGTLGAYLTAELQRVHTELVGSAEVPS
jgi:Rad52/22 family double-strand break repair protein